MPNDPTSPLTARPTAHLTADAVDSVLRSTGTCERKLSDLREMVTLSRRALDPPPETRKDARAWPILIPSDPLRPVDRYDPRD